jgi:flagellin-specific chaperone FliS
MISKSELVEYIFAKCKQEQADAAINCALISEHSEKVEKATNLFEAMEAMLAHSQACAELNEDLSVRRGRVEAYTDILKFLGTLIKLNP